MDKDAALLELAQQRGLLSAGLADQLARQRGTRSAAAVLVEDGHLEPQVVRALRTELQKRVVNHAFDGYQLIGKLGAGGMSVVFKATDVVSRRLVAIKVVSPKVIGDQLFLDRFQREARSAAAVVHPHVIACHGLGQTRGKAYMVLEYMAGGDTQALAERLGGHLDERRVLEIAADCTRGLEAIHAHGLVHRDIKPSNIFLDDHGRAKLADLGLAKSESPDDQLTMPGMRVGSPGYMAPEQASGSSPTDIRSDIYSLGATMFHLLAGRGPFIGRSPLEIILNGLRQEPPPLQSIAPWVSQDTADLVGRCLQRDPAERFQQPHDLRQALEAALQRMDATASRRPAANTRPPSDGRARWLRSRILAPLAAWAARLRRLLPVPTHHG
jgi:serine/threonine-protein kinase